MVPKLNRPSIGILVVLAMPLALMGLEPGAAAAGLDKKGSADAKRATQLYKQGSYEEAAAVFLQLSLDNPGMPVFVRNLGACYYYLRRPDPALSNLREYLVKKKDVTPEDRAEVEGWIAEMDQLRQRGPTPAAAPVPAALPATPTPPVPVALPPPAPVAPPPPAQVAPTPPVPAPGAYTPLPPAQPPAAPAVMPETPPARYDVPPVQPQAPPGPAPYPAPPFAPAQYPPQYPAQYPPQYPAPYPAPETAPPPALGPAVTTAQVPPPAESGSGRRTAGWVLGGVGVAGLLAGGAFTVLAVLDFSDVEKKYDPGKKSDGETLATWQWVPYGVGGAAIVTAIILLATGRDTPPRSVVLAPTVGPGMAGAALSGSF